MQNNLSLTSDAYASIKGSSAYPNIQGEVHFYGVHGGTIVTVHITGLPENSSGNFYGFHIHEGRSCTGNTADPFKDAGGHYNPEKKPHPYHVGDMPVLMGNKGIVWCEFYTDRFFPEDIIGRTVIIHDMPDDFRSQPSGDSGTKIGCGVIK